MELDPMGMEETQEPLYDEQNIQPEEASYNAALGVEIAEVESEPTEQEAAMSSAPQLVDDEIRSMILRRKEASRTWKQAKKDIWDKCWNHYKQVYDKSGKESWQSTTFIPASPKVAEVIISNMHAALLSPENPVEYQARQPIFEKQVSEANDLISTDCDRSDFKVHWTDILRNIGIIGTGVGKVDYVKESAVVTIKERVRQVPGMDMMRRLIGLPPAPTETTTQKRMLVKDYASTRSVDPYNIFPEPGSEDFDKDRWVIEEGKICNYKLIELMKDEDNPIRNVTEELLTSNPRDLENPDEQEKDAAQDEPVKTSAYLDPDQEHILDEYWGPAPIWMVQPELYGDESRKYEMVNAWFWLIDGQHVVRAQITPFRDAEPPYVKGVYIRVPGQFWGIGPLELMLGLQIELNESRNCRQDEINLKLSKPIAVIKSMIAQGEFGRLVNGPGAIWLFDNIDDVRKAMMQIELDANLGDSWRGSAEIYNEIQEVTAANKATIGAGGGSDQDGGGTFRGQLLNKQTSSERFIMYAKILEKTGLSKAYKKMYQRIYQYKGWKEAGEILGEKRAQEFEFTPPEMLDVMAKIVPLGVTSMENKGIQLAQMMEEFKLLSQFPWYKPVEAARRMVVQRGQADSSSVIFTDEELKIFNEQRQKMIGEMGGLPGSGEGLPPKPGEMPGPIAGDTPPPMGGMPRPAMPARGPGASPVDSTGRPLS